MFQLLYPPTIFRSFTYSEYIPSWIELRDWFKIPRSLLSTIDSLYLQCFSCYTNHNDYAGLTRKDAYYNNYSFQNFLHKYINVI